MSTHLPGSYLKARFAHLAKEIGWHTVSPRWYQQAGENKAVIGHVSLEHNSVYGWNINCIVNDAGSERRLLESCTARELDAWLTGALFVLQMQEDAKRLSSLGAIPQDCTRRGQGGKANA